MYIFNDVIHFEGFFNIQIVNIQTLNIHTPILKKQNKQY